MRDQIDSFIELALSANKVDRLRRLSNGNGFSDIIYIGDGQSDIPAFRFVKKRKGLSVSVFDPSLNDKVNTSARMLADGIVSGIESYIESIEMAFKGG